MPRLSVPVVIEQAVLNKMRDEGLDGWAAHAEVMAEVQAILPTLSKNNREWFLAAVTKEQYDYSARQ